MVGIDVGAPSAPESDRFLLDEIAFMLYTARKVAGSTLWRFPAATERPIAAQGGA